MARGRMLSKSFSTSKRRARLFKVAEQHDAEFAGALFMLLLAHADDFGRLPGDVFDVRLVVEPLSPRTEDELESAVELLVTVGLVDWHTTIVDARAYNVIQINDFDAHQGGLHKRTTSKLPDRAGNFRGVPSQLNLTELNRTELKGTSTRTREKARAARDPDPKTAEQNIKVITALVIADVLPLGIPDDEMIEATKALCARKHIAYDAAAVSAAVDGARRATR